MKAKNIDPAEARSCLKPHLATMLDKALRDLDAREADIARIRELEVVVAQTEPDAPSSIVQKAPQLPRHLRRTRPFTTMSCHPGLVPGAVPPRDEAVGPISYTNRRKL